MSLNHIIALMMVLEFNMLCWFTSKQQILNNSIPIIVQIKVKHTRQKPP